MSPERRRLIHEMGLGPVWTLRQTAPPSEHMPGGDLSAIEARVAMAGMHDSSDALRNNAMPDDVSGWSTLAEEVASCRACGLCEGRNQAVLGVGDVTADWLFVGEGPGAEEDQRGEPFVGQAGKLLDNMLAAIGLKRGHDVYIANAVKCRPPGNRTPESVEIETCRPFLERQITMIRPRLIVALGRPAAQALLGHEVKIAAARGRLHDRQGVPLVVTYHPAYLLRNLLDKEKAWEDLCFMRTTMAGLKGQADA